MLGSGYFGIRKHFFLILVLAACTSIETPMILILFTTVAPCTLTDELSLQGHEAYEALAISEVLSLAEQFSTASIIITQEVDQARACVIQQHWPTVRLCKQFPLMDILWN